MKVFMRLRLWQRSNSRFIKMAFNTPVGEGRKCMHLKVINSSSKGNGYVLESNTDSLLIECGVKFKQIQSTLNYDLSSIKGCLISHEHL